MLLHIYSGRFSFIFVSVLDMYIFNCLGAANSYIQYRFCLLNIKQHRYCYASRRIRIAAWLITLTNHPVLKVLECNMYLSQVWATQLSSSLAVGEETRRRRRPKDDPVLFQRPGSRWCWRKRTPTKVPHASSFRLGREPERPSSPGYLLNVDNYLQMQTAFGQGTS